MMLVKLTYDYQGNQKDTDTVDKVCESQNTQYKINMYCDQECGNELKTHLHSYPFVANDR